MKCIKKPVRLNFIIIFSCLLQTLTISANAAGFVFNWQPFIADINLVPDNPDKQVLIKNIYVDDISTAIAEDFKEMVPLSADQDSLSEQKSKKKFLPDNIKLTSYHTSSFMPDRLEKYNFSDDEQLSKTIHAMTSFIYGESKIKSLETIGKIIEPQVNIYFKF